MSYLVYKKDECCTIKSVVLIWRILFLIFDEIAVRIEIFRGKCACGNFFSSKFALELAMNLSKTKSD